VRSRVLRRPTRRDAALAIGAGALAPLAVRARPQSQVQVPTKVPAPLEVGFVYVSPIGTSGWTYQHEQGRLALEHALGARVRTRRVESVAEGADSERVMRDLASQGLRLVFATSFGYLEPALRVAADHPSLVIEHAGGFKTARNLGTYNARFYEARWLAGLLAGRVTRSGVAGYVAGFPVPEVIQGINAFTLGMRMVRPDARVRVIWLDAWFDPARERDAATTLVDAGADLLTNHSGSPAVPGLAQARGVRLVGYQSDMRAHAPTMQLAAIVADWSGHYERTARAVIDGTWSPRATWGGMREGMVRLEAVDASLPEAVKRELETRRQALIDGRDGPFVGRLLDQSGRERHAGGAMDDVAVAGMNWFVQGVVGSPTGS
jgi:simple sugar transport system substrate-binding protein